MPDDAALPLFPELRDASRPVPIIELEAVIAKVIQCGAGGRLAKEADVFLATV